MLRLFGFFHLSCEKLLSRFYSLNCRNMEEHEGRSAVLYRHIILFVSMNREKRKKTPPPNGFCCCPSLFYFHTQLARLFVLLLSWLQCFQPVYNIHNKLLTFPKLKYYFSENKKLLPLADISKRHGRALHRKKNLVWRDFAAEGRASEMHTV